MPHRSPHAALSRAGLAALFLLGCTTPGPGAAGEAWVLRGGTVVLGPAHALATDLTIRGGRVAAIGPGDASLPAVDVTGAWLAPAFIDSHVHLAYRPEPLVLARGGVAAAVDLAAPGWFLASAHPPLEVRASGPMLTALVGYPTQGWGRGGYGLEVATAAEAVAAVDHLADAGAALIKLALDDFGPQLEPAVQRAAVEEAHRLGLRVAAHALGDTAAAAAAAAGADILAHTPVGPLGPATVRAWRGRTVLSTLAAFGGSPAALANLRTLRDAGVTVLYGTDFGNGAPAGIDAAELALLGEAGLDGAELLEAGTAAPAAFWGFASLGALAPGRAASLLVLDQDPRLAPATLAHPRAVYLDGVLVPAR
jgi:imidazolonepropionase-like amidohydrolase